MHSQGGQILATRTMDACRLVASMLCAHNPRMRVRACSAIAPATLTKTKSCVLELEKRVSVWRTCGCPRGVRAVGAQRQMRCGAAWSASLRAHCLGYGLKHRMFPCNTGFTA